MSHQPIARSSAESWENEGAGLGASTSAERLGVTRFLTETYVVGGHFYTTLADAVAEGRRLQVRGVGS